MDGRACRKSHRRLQNGPILGITCTYSTSKQQTLRHAGGHQEDPHLNPVTYTLINIVAFVTNYCLHPGLQALLAFYPHWGSGGFG